MLDILRAEVGMSEEKPKVLFVDHNPQPEQCLRGLDIEYVVVSNFVAVNQEFFRHDTSPYNAIIVGMVDQSLYYKGKTTIGVIETIRSSGYHGTIIFMSKSSDLRQMALSIGPDGQIRADHAVRDCEELNRFLHSLLSSAKNDKTGS